MGEISRGNANAVTGGAGIRDSAAEWEHTGYKQRCGRWSLIVTAVVFRYMSSVQGKSVKDPGVAGKFTFLPAGRARPAEGLENSVLGLSGEGFSIFISHKRAVLLSTLATPERIPMAGYSTSPPPIVHVFNLDSSPNPHSPHCSSTSSLSR